MRRVVVTGIGIVAPNGVGRDAFSEAIVEGRSGVSTIESFDTSGQAIKIAGEVKGFDVLPYLVADGPANMALDEAMLEAAARGERACLRLYGWSEPTLSLGYFQPIAEARADPRWRGRPVVRRPTGGGAIWHHHELTYAIAVPPDSRPVRPNTALYRVVHGAIAALLTESGIPAHRRRNVAGMGALGRRMAILPTERDLTAERPAHRHQVGKGRADQQLRRACLRCPGLRCPGLHRPDQGGGLGERAVHLPIAGDQRAHSGRHGVLLCGPAGPDRSQIRPKPLPGCVIRAIRRFRRER